MKFYDEAPWVFGVSPHTGEPKTLHCIPMLPNDRMLCLPSGVIENVVDNGISSQSWRPRTRVSVGGEYCVKSEQRAPALGRIEVLKIAYYNAKLIPAVSLLAYGLSTWIDFVEVWAHRHDTAFYDRAILGKRLRGFEVMALINKRPDHLYTAWAITFAPVAS